MNSTATDSRIAEALDQARRWLSDVIRPPQRLIVDPDRHRPGWVIGVVPPPDHPDLTLGPDHVYTTNEGLVYIALATCPTLDDLLSALEGMMCLSAVMRRGLG